MQLDLFQNTTYYGDSVLDDTRRAGERLKRVRGLGMPRRRSGGKGDLHVAFSVLFPQEPVSGEARKLLAQVLPRRAARGGGKGPGAPRAGEKLYQLQDEPGAAEDDEAGSFWSSW